MSTSGTSKMSVIHTRNAIINLLESELRRGGWTLEELGEKIEYILRSVPLTKKVKDKNAPKKPRTSYTFFCQKNRVETVESMGKDCKSTEVVRALAERWRKLKLECENRDENATNEMQEYNVKSKEDKERYYVENAAYEERLHPSPE